MKQLLNSLFIAGLVSQVHGQGLVNFGNSANTQISTNYALFWVGVTATTPNSYYYTLLTAPSTVTTVDNSLQQLLTSTWTFTGLYATNSPTLAGRLFGGNGVPAIGWAPDATNSYIVVGWSASVGTTWAAAASKLNGAFFGGGGVWSGGGINPLVDWLGASSVGFGQAGGTDPNTGLPLFAFSLFGSPSPIGSPISSGFSLYTAAPEPSSYTLLGLALLLKLARRIARIG
jgi:hypothetical protein